MTLTAAVSLLTVTLESNMRRSNGNGLGTVFPAYPKRIKND